MEKITCIFVALALMAVCICINIFSDNRLRRKTDNRSRIKVEARRKHYEEDRNKRITKDLVPRKSPFLWTCREIDNNISKMLEMEHKINDK